MRIKKAFTLAEAILTMVILGIIATTMITILKPGQYRSQGYGLLKKKTYAMVDEVTQTILTECTSDMSLAHIYPDCNKAEAETPAAFSTASNEIYAKYMRGKAEAANTANAGCTTDADRSSLKLKNGACLYFGTVDKEANPGAEYDYEIFVDVNGDEGPNSVDDQFTIEIKNDGVYSDLPR